MVDKENLKTNLENLSPGQEKILRCYISLQDNDELTPPSLSDIAKELDITYENARKQMSNLYKLLGITNNKNKNIEKKGALKTLYFQHKKLFDSILFPEPPSITPANSDFQETKQQQSHHDFATYQQEYWVGREEEIKHFSNSLNNSCRIAILLGITGIGKTALAEKLVEELSINQDALLRKNFEDQPTSSEETFAETAKKWLIKLGEKVSLQDDNPQKLLLSLLDKLCHNHYIIIIDSFEYILTGNEDTGWGDFIDEWWYEFLRRILSAEDCQSKIIITSQDLPLQLQEIGSRYPNYFDYQIIKGLEESNQINLFQKHGLSCNEKTKPLLARIGKAYMGHPLAINVIAREIKIDLNGSIVEYWEIFGSEIEKVEKSLKEAEEGKAQGIDDWELAQYSRQLRREVKKRLEITFERLEVNSYIAFKLICKASVYRKPERESAWLFQLKSDYDKKEIRQALDMLKDRALIEITYDPKLKRNLLGLHNLIRSQALHCLRSIEQG